METVRDILSSGGTLILPLVIVGFVVYGLVRRVPVYESFVAGAKEGFSTAVMIIPYVVAMLVAIAMFRASGAMELLTESLRPAMRAVGFPEDVLPMALIRPLTGTGSLGVLGDTIKQHGVNSEAAAINATIFASSETTFYVIAVYFGAVAIRRTRHAILTGLIADAAGVIFAIVFVRLLVA